MINNKKIYLKSSDIHIIKQKVCELGISSIGMINDSYYTKLSKQYHKKAMDGPRDYFSDCCSIISAALSYQCDWNNVNSSAEGYIARYTTANFYRILSARLKKLGKFIKEHLGINIADSSFFRVFVNSKLNDKWPAYCSGLGRFSKNSLLYVDHHSQQFVLGQLLLAVNLELEEQRPDDGVHIQCSRCSACINNCPTNALIFKKGHTVVRKGSCIQHLSSELDWPETISGKSFLKIWKTRFFGCTDCVDICPLNKKKDFVNYQPAELMGYIGTVFSPDKILGLNKGDYKKCFQKNQLAASWVPETALARNGLAALYNLGQRDRIFFYLRNITQLGWNDKEQDFLRKFIKNYLKV